MMTTARDSMMTIFVLHNLEELITSRRLPLIDEAALQRVGLDRGHLRSDRLAAAMALLTGAAYGTVRAVNHGSAVGGGALLMNSLGHVGRAVRTGRWNPGLASAVPLAVAAWTVLHRAKGSADPWRAETVVSGVLGATFSVPCTVLSLRVARRVRP